MLPYLHLSSLLMVNIYLLEKLNANIFLFPVVPLSLVSGNGEPFDIELYPPGLEAAHQLLSKEELQHMFGVDQPHMVDHTRWK